MILPDAVTSVGCDAADDDDDDDGNDDGEIGS